MRCDLLRACLFTPAALSKPVSPGARVRPHNPVHLQRVGHPWEDPAGDTPGPGIPHPPHRVAHRNGNKSPGSPAGWLLAAAFPARWKVWGSAGDPPPSLPHLTGACPDSPVQSFAVFLIHAERKKGVQASGVLFGYWLLCSLLPATSAAQQASQGVSGGLGHGGRDQSGGPGPWVLPFPHTTLSTQHSVTRLLRP